MKTTNKPLPPVATIHWQEAVPGNMPEDFYPTHAKRIVGATFESTPLVMVLMTHIERFDFGCRCKVNDGTWAWANLDHIGYPYEITHWAAFEHPDWDAKAEKEFHDAWIRDFQTKAGIR